MKKTVLITIACLLLVPTAKSQTLEDLFLSMPAKILPTINRERRLDLVYLHKVGEKAETRDQLSSIYLLTAFQDNYIQIQSDNNSLELISLPMINDSRIILVIKTICVPACDSEWNFYTDQWKKIDPTAILQPVGKEWFIPETTDRNNLNTQALDIDLMKFSYDPEKKMLVQEYQSPERLIPEEKEKIKKYLKNEAKTYRWTGMRFE